MNKFEEILKVSKVNSILLKSGEINDENFNYFTELPKSISGTNYLIIKRNSETIYANQLDFGAIKSEIKNKKIKIKKISKEKDFKNLLKKELIGKIGINFDKYSLKGYNTLKKITKYSIRDMSNHLEKIREVKTPNEIKKIKEAVKVSIESLDELIPKIKIGMKEKEIQFILDGFIAKNECKNSFETIIASGKNSAIPHHISSNKKIKKGEILLIDFGAEYKNYTSDISRTFFIGKAPEKIKEMYSTGIKAMENSLKKIGEGKKALNAFKACEETLKQHNYPMIHALGHGIGLKVHDFPQSIGVKSEWIFKKNFVLAIEPGIYIKNLGGIRIEDDIIVTNSAPKKLSNAPKELIEL